MKICNTCKEEKPLTADYWHKGRNKDGFQNQCKTCRNAYNKQKQKEKWNDPIGRKKIQESSKKYYDNNRTKILEQMADYRKTEAYKNSYKQSQEKWVSKNRDKINAYRQSYTKKYKLTDKGRMILNISHYKSKSRINHGEILDDFTIDDWYNCKNFFQNKCAYCGTLETETNKLIMEHLIPLSKSKDFTKKNIVCSCHRCNVKKKQMTLSDFYTSYNKPIEFNEDRYRNILKYLNEIDS